MATSKIKDFITDDEMNALEGGNTPDFISDEEMNRLEPQPIKKPSFNERITAAGQEPFTKMRETAKGVVEGRISKPEGILRSMGDIAGGASKITSEYITSPIKAITPSFVKEGIRKAPEEIGSMIPDIMKKGAGKVYELSGLKKGIAADIEWIKTHPETMRNLGAVGNMAGAALGTGIGAPIAKTAVKGAAEGLGEGLVKTSGRIQGTKVKINIPEMKKGASNEMYTKYGVFGNAKKVKDQWQNNINGLYGQVKEKISQAADNPENYASIEDIFSAAKQSASKYGKSKTAVADIHKQLDALKSKFDEVYPDGMINILDAQVEKQVIGKKGDWLARSGQISGNPDASVGSQAHNALYDALKTNVENKGSEGIRELNKQISEMIPMERAASKQVLVQNRKNLIPMDDYIGALTVASAAASGNLLPVAIAGANVLSKSPTVAKALYKTGKALSSESGFIGSKTELGNASFNKFMGKKIAPQAEAILRNPKNFEAMRTMIENASPAQRSGMIKRLKEMYPESQWKEFAPLFGTLGMGAGITGSGLTAYGMLNKK